MTIVLYDLVGAGDCRFSPYCWRTRMALAHKGLDFDARPVPFTGISAIGDGSHKTVPVIDDRGTVVSDSFAIALHLEAAYPDRPSLFGGPGGAGMARFVDSFANATLHPLIAPLVVKDIHDRVTEADKAYFRASREARFGRRLEEVQADREQRVEAFRLALAPLRVTLKRQPFLSGAMPLYADHIVFGTLQWPRLTSPFSLIEAGDPVGDWFERCLDLYGGIGRAMPAAA